MNNCIFYPHRSLHHFSAIKQRDAAKLIAKFGYNWKNKEKWAGVEGINESQQSKLHLRSELKT